MIDNGDVQNFEPHQQCNAFNKINNTEKKELLNSSWHSISIRYTKSLIQWTLNSFRIQN